MDETRAPYKSEHYTAAFLSAGRIHLQAGLTAYDVQAPALITLGPGVIRSIIQQPEAAIKTLYFKDAFLLLKHNFFENSDLHVLALKDLLLIKTQRIFDLIALTTGEEIIRHYIFALIYEIDAYYKQHPPAISHPVFTKFSQLLHRYSIQEHRLDFYALQLEMTPKYLSAFIKKHTGKSAGEWIDQSILLEAKVLLQNEQLSIAEVSNALHFSDQSVFGKFFRANTGTTPIAWRASIKNPSL
jgi:AraC-like DNA-binding protein